MKKIDPESLLSEFSPIMRKLEDISLGRGVKVSTHSYENFYSLMKASFNPTKDSNRIYIILFINYIIIFHKAEKNFYKAERNFHKRIESLIGMNRIFHSHLLGKSPIIIKIKSKSLLNIILTYLILLVTMIL